MMIFSPVISFGASKFFYIIVVLGNDVFAWRSVGVLARFGVRKALFPFIHPFVYFLNIIHHLFVT